MVDAIVAGATNEGAFEGAQVAASDDQQICLDRLDIIDNLIAGLTAPNNHLARHLVLDFFRQVVNAWYLKVFLQLGLVSADRFVAIILSLLVHLVNKGRTVHC